MVGILSLTLLAGQLPQRPVRVCSDCRRSKPAITAAVVPAGVFTSSQVAAPVVVVVRCWRRSSRRRTRWRAGSA